MRPQRDRLTSARWPVYVLMRIDAVMAAQAELVDVVHTLKQVMCIKG